MMSFVIRIFPKKLSGSSKLTAFPIIGAENGSGKLTRLEIVTP
jgi:hypothetical protein